LAVTKNIIIHYHSPVHFYWPKNDPPYYGIPTLGRWFEVLRWSTFKLLRKWAVHSLKSVRKTIWI